MSTYFVVGDIHGKAQMLEELMTEWDGKAQLVFLGDLMDRGENSKRSIEIVKDYVRSSPASILAISSIRSSLLSKRTVDTVECSSLIFSI